MIAATRVAPLKEESTRKNKKTNFSKAEVRCAKPCVNKVVNDMCKHDNLKSRNVFPLKRKGWKWLRNKERSKTKSIGAAQIQK